MARWRKRRDSTLWTASLGWWSLKGLIFTPFVLIDKVKAFLYEGTQSEEIIEKFIKQNIGKITLGQDNQRVISRLINGFNKVEEDIGFEDMLKSFQH